jgi:hypothetical protein
MGSNQRRQEEIKDSELLAFVGTIKINKAPAIGREQAK